MYSVLNKISIDKSGNIGIGTNLPLCCLDASQKTDAIIVPIGNTSNVPIILKEGMLRINTTTNSLQIYNGNWETIQYPYPELESASTSYFLTSSDQIIITGIYFEVTMEWEFIGSDGLSYLPIVTFDSSTQVTLTCPTPFTTDKNPYTLRVFSVINGIFLYYPSLFYSSFASTSYPSGTSIVLEATTISQINNTTVSSWGIVNIFSTNNSNYYPTYYSSGGYNNAPYVRFLNKVLSHNPSISFSNGLSLMFHFNLQLSGDYEQLFEIITSNNVYIKLYRYWYTNDLTIEINGNNFELKNCFTINQWIVIGIIYDPITAKIKVYKNNILQLDVSATLNLSDKLFTTFNIGNASYSDIYISKFFLYNKVLTTSEISILYNYIISISSLTITSSQPSAIIQNTTTGRYVVSYLFTSNKNNVLWSINPITYGKINKNTGVLTLVFPKGTSNSGSFTVSVKDTDSVSIQTWNYNVTSMPIITSNKPSNISVNTRYAAYTQSYQFQALGNSITWSISPTTYGTINNTTRLLTLVFPQNSTVNGLITVTATNNNGSDSQSWFYSINSINIIVSSLPDNINANTSISAYTITYYFYANQGVIWSINNTTYGNINPYNGILTLTFNKDTFASGSLTVTATSSSNNIDTQTWSYNSTIDPIITSNKIASINLNTSNRSYQLPYQFTANTSVTWSINNITYGNINSSGFLNLSIPANTINNGTFTVTATNAFGSSTQSWIYYFTLGELAISSINPTDISLNTTSSPYTLQYSFVATEPNIKWYINISSYGNIDNSGNLTLTFNQGIYAVHTFIVSATINNSKSVSQTWNCIVVPNLTLLTNTPNTLNANTSGSIYNISYTFTANQPVTWSISPTIYSDISGSYNTISFSPIISFPIYLITSGTFTITATNIRSNILSQSWNYNITNTPIITSSTPTNISTSTSTTAYIISYTFSANQFVTWTINNSTYGNIDGSGNLTLTFPLYATTSGTFIVTATNSVNNTSTQSWTYTTVNIPSITSPTPVNIIQSTTSSAYIISYTFTADQPVTWSINNSTYGNIDSSGNLTITFPLYTITSGTFIVTATNSSNYTSTKSWTYSTTNVLLITSSTPTDISTNIVGEQYDISYTFVANQPVTWSINNSTFGNINSSTGVLSLSFTNINTVSGTFIVTATIGSGSSTTKTWTYNVTNILLITYTPTKIYESTFSYPYDYLYQFTASKVVTWSINTNPYAVINSSSGAVQVNFSKGIDISGTFIITATHSIGTVSKTWLYEIYSTDKPLAVQTSFSGICGFSGNTQFVTISGAKGYNTTESVEYFNNLDAANLGGGTNRQYPELIIQAINGDVLTFTVRRRNANNYPSGTSFFIGPPSNIAYISNTTQTFSGTQDTVFTYTIPNDLPLGNYVIGFIHNYSYAIGNICSTDSYTSRILYSLHVIKSSKIPTITSTLLSNIISNTSTELYTRLYVFTANQPVTWSITPTTYGNIDNSGNLTIIFNRYTTISGTFVVTALNSLGFSKQQSWTYTITNTPIITSINPDNIYNSITTSAYIKSYSFTANQTVTWSISPTTFGTINSSGQLTTTFPSNTNNFGLLTVTATNAAGYTISQYWGYNIGIPDSSLAISGTLTVNASTYYNQNIDDHRNGESGFFYIIAYPDYIKESANDNYQQWATPKNTYNYDGTLNLNIYPPSIIVPGYSGHWINMLYQTRGVVKYIKIKTTAANDASTVVCGPKKFYVFGILDNTKFNWTLLDTFTANIWPTTPITQTFTFTNYNYVSGLLIIFESIYPVTTARLARISLDQISFSLS